MVQARDRSAGYSGTPLVKKLGIKPGMRVAFVGAPEAYGETLGPLPDEVRQMVRPGKDMDLIHGFVRSQRELAARFPRWKDALAKDGSLWVSWPKKASEVETDLDGNVVRNIGLAGGLVDVKVAAVDEVWSGLKFMYRKKDR